MKIRHYIFQILFSLLVGSVHGQGIIFQHSGANDPTTESFSANIQGQASPVLNDLGMDAWATTASSPDKGVIYTYFLTSQQQTALAAGDWSLAVTLRIPLNYGVAGHGNTFMNFFTGTEGFSLEFAFASNGDPIVGANAQLYTLNNAGSTYNNYQLVYSATADAASLWVNGTEEINNITSAVGTPGVGSVIWGESQQSIGQANWNLLSLTVTPEPSPISLIFLGTGILFYIRRRK
jgi:hypothetical protein